MFGHFIAGPLRCAAALLLAFLLVPAVAAAQQADTTGHHVIPPPDPDARDPELFVDVHFGLVVPLYRGDVCPGDAVCVMGTGGAFGVEVERRWPVGLGVRVAYDAWFIDSGGVFELGLAQLIRAGVRYVFDVPGRLHPGVHLGAGAFWFGDTGLVSTVGVALDFGATAELELTSTVSLTAGFHGWMFTTTPFTTQRDNTSRSEGLGVNLSIQTQIGISVVTDG